MPELDPRPRFVSPCCRAALFSDHPASLACTHCRTPFPIRDDIHRFMLPGRLQEIAPFLDQYRRVRTQDGFRVPGPDYYRDLPDVTPSHPQAAIWRVRRTSFDHLRSQILDRIGGHPLTVLELGAGNAWLCHRLTCLGHTCVAVDLLDDAEDGLGAARHYPQRFTTVQADYDRLPFEAGQFDVVVFNGSLHYAPDLESTLASADQVMHPEGVLVAMDSPTFRSGAAGRQMVVEVDRQFRLDYGLSRIARPGPGYVTRSALARAARTLGLTDRYVPSRPGALWELRRWFGSLKNRREAARFGLWIATRTGRGEGAPCVDPPGQSDQRPCRHQ